MMARFQTISFAILIVAAGFVCEASAQRKEGQRRNHDDAVANGQRGPQGGQAQRGQQRKGQRNGGGQGQSEQGLNAQQAALRMMANFDADGDGLLNTQELTNGLVALEQAMRQRQGSQGRGQQGGGRNASGNEGGEEPQAQRGGRGRGAPSGASNGTRGSQGRGGGQRRGR